MVMWKYKTIVSYANRSYENAKRLGVNAKRSEEDAKQLYGHYTSLWGDVKQSCENGKRSYYMQWCKTAAYGNGRVQMQNGRVKMQNSRVNIQNSRMAMQNGQMKMQFGRVKMQSGCMGR